MRVVRISRAALLLTTAALFSGTVAARPAQGSDFDGSRDLLCAPKDVADCDTAARCERESLADANLPSSIHVQFSKKRLTGPGGDERSTAIQNVQNLSGLTILQGAENGRAWSMVIDQSNGRLSASITDSDGAFSIFGACSPE
jgi:hypothetical protein